jgi:hypothetical protein
MEMELKTVVASVFFGSDEANPDNLGHFTMTPDVRLAVRRRSPAIDASSPAGK